jgi:membrane protein required for colicin V production
MDSVSLLDGIVLVVVLVSALLAMYRGIMREIFSIGSWVAAAAAAYLLYKPAIPYIKPYAGSASETVLMGATAGGIFIVTLIVVSYITMKISDFVLDSAFGALDRSAGFLFGAARGVLLLVVAMQFFNFFVSAEQTPTWVANSKAKPYLDQAGDKLRASLPEDLQKWISQVLRKKTGEDDAGGAGQDG